MTRTIYIDTRRAASVHPGALALHALVRSQTVTTAPALSRLVRPEVLTKVRGDE
jgi:hypothetical protein